ncbi:MAG: IclR family transcriptional regulator [Deltaproteobacteria bacterium]|nr:IclR family transcriptional regulator [Deltaproteobacteria bacterium]
MSEKSSYYTIQSIAKTFEVIEAMAMQPQWELAALCRQTGLPKTTVHRILLTLEEMGYVAQEKERGQYVLTFKLTNLGFRIANNTDLVEIARPYCSELRDSIDETVNLCTLSGTEMLVMDRQPTRQLLRLDSIVGSSFPCFYSASGKAFMAFIEEAALFRLLDKIRIEAKGSVSNRDIQNLRAELKKVHESCLAHDYEEVWKSVRCVASPIFDHQHRVVATVGMSAPTMRMDDHVLQEVGLQVLHTASQISKRLGASFYPVSIEHKLVSSNGNGIKKFAQKAG